MSVVCCELVKYLEDRYPLSYAEKWDNCGLLVGDFSKQVSRILICLEVNNEIISEAADLGVDMIVSHHPLIYKPLSTITSSGHISSMVIRLIKEDISLYVLHTNFDNGIEGMNDIIANILELENVKVLHEACLERLYKLAVFVPASYAQQLRDALFEAGAGCIGNYSHCSFNTDGTGTFLPLNGTSPFIGAVGELEKVNEVKVETIVGESKLNRVIESMLKVHPYEEVAYDVYALNNSLSIGTGRYGDMKNEVRLLELCEIVKSAFKLPSVDVTGDLDACVRKVAVVGGSGMDFVIDCRVKGCDVLITGDVKHHEAIEAALQGLYVIDAGHYHTEVVALPFIAQLISTRFNVDCYISKVNTNPFQRI